MTDYQAIYRNDAERYDRMVAAEDVDHSVIATLESFVSLRGARVVEVGVGTGRITTQLVDRGAEVRGVEPELAMLTIARERLAKRGVATDTLSTGSLDSLPFASASADLAVAGWVFGHQRSFEPERWRATVGVGIAEMVRVVRPGGLVVLFETLGTAVEEPSVREDLAELQMHLESAHGFTRIVLRTDYAFPTADEAASALAFFFGETVAARIRERSWARVPEWTGAWWKRVGDEG